MPIPIIAIIIGIAVLIIGVTGGIFALEVVGVQQPDVAKTPKYRRIHHALGYTFITLFLLTSMFMIIRLKFWPVTVEPRVILHWALAESVIAIVIGKIVINRKYKKLYSHLPALGGAVLLCTFVMLMLTAGYYGARHIGGPGTGDNYAQGVIMARCTRCHSLARVHAFSGDEAKARKALDDMRQYSEGWLSSKEIDILAAELAKEKPAVQKQPTSP